MRVLLPILSFFFPIVGFIAYSVRKDSDDDAGLYLGAGVVGFIVGLLTMI